MDWRGSGTAYRDVRYEIAEGIAKITIDRPEVRNAFRPQTVTEMIRAFDDARDDGSIGVVILTGAGDKAFCVGSDLRQRNEMTKEQWLRQRADFDRTLYTLRQFRKPIFAAVNGPAFGGGSECAQSCDFIIASENAIFGQP